MDNYGLIEWYMGKQTFKDFEGDTRDHVLDISSEKFFDEMINYAKGKAETNKKANSLSGLSISRWRSQIAGEIENGANEYFDNQAIIKINNSGLNLDYKGDLISDVGSYNSLDQVEDDIIGLKDLQQFKRQKEDLADTIRNSRDLSEIQDAEDDLRSLDSKALGGVKSGISRNAGKEKAELLSSIDDLIDQARDEEEEIQAEENQ